MQMVERFCHRAMLITDGEIEMIGDPPRVGARYLERNFESFRTGGAPQAAGDSGARAEISDVWLENESGMHIDTAPHGQRLHLRARIDVRDHVREPVVDFWVDDEEGARVFATSTRPWPEAPPLAPGDTLEVAVDADNPLASGRYHIGCSLLSGSAGLEVVALVNRHKPFVVFAGEHVYGLVSIDHELRVDRS
jgi:hypothetical protein